MSPADSVKRLSSLRRAAVVLGALIILGLLGYMVYARPDPASLAALGYPGVALLMFFSSGSIVLPAPGFAAVLAAGAIWNPVLVGIAAGLGSATGELSGYLLGIGGGAMLHLKEGKRWNQASRWLKRYGFWAILVVASIPSPFFDIIGLVAGSLAYPIRRFWIACLLGNSLKYTMLAFLGSSATAWWLHG